MIYSHPNVVVIKYLAIDHTVVWISRGEAKITKMQKRGNRVKCLVLGFPTGISMKISQIASTSTSSTVAASHWSRNVSCDIARPTQHSPEVVTVPHKNRTQENKQIKNREIQKERKKET